MAQQPPKEEKKIDFSSLPRGAINIKGLPVSRNARLPSIRSPRDLTLGAPPKRMFMPNIPVRREKKPLILDNASQAKQESLEVDKKGSPQNDREKGRGRIKPNIIQTQGSIFSEGIAADPLMRKEKMRNSYEKFGASAPSRGVIVKKEKEDDDVGGINNRMSLLFRDDFIDDKDGDDFENDFKPVMFPIEIATEAKVEAAEPAPDFNPDIAKEMDFDVNRIAKFIKKEKGTEVEEKKTLVSTDASSNKIINLFNGDEDSSKLVLIKFPEIFNLDQKMEDSEPHKKTGNADSKNSDKQSIRSASIKSLPEGYIGKLQILKSGKTRLLIGSVEFNLDSLNSLQAKHELVSIHTNSNTGDLSVLGGLQQKLTFVPDEDCLLNTV